MSQVEVLRFMKANKDKWVSTKEISESLGITITSCGANMTKITTKTNLLKMKLVKTNRCSRRIPHYKYVG